MGGHVETGVMTTALMAVRTDIDGDFTSSANFNNAYSATDIYGYPLNFNGGQVVEFSDGTGYAALGSYNVNMDNIMRYGIAYMELDLNGNVIHIKGYEMPQSSGVIDIGISSAMESPSSPGDLYATGWCHGPNEGRMIFAMRITRDGFLTWGNLMDFLTSTAGEEKAHDIVESPYNTSDVYVAGSLLWSGYNFPNGGAQEDAFIVTLDRANGGIIKTRLYDGGHLEGFGAMNVSNDPGAPGFILAGWRQDDACFYPNNNKECLVTKLDQSLNVEWSNRYADTYTTWQKFEGYDVCGRMNTGGQYEYYVTGKKDLYYWDVFALKLDSWGNPFPNGLFTYSSDPNTGQYGMSIDVNTSGTGDGLSIYAYNIDLYPTMQSYLIKAYFNGESGCNQDFEDVILTPVNLWQLPVKLNSNPLVAEPLLHVLTQSNDNMLLCYEATIPSGDNFRTADAPATGINQVAALFPNPASTTDQQVNLSVNVSQDELITVTLTDVPGRKMLSRNYAVTKGTTMLKLELGETLSKGLYLVTIDKLSGRETLTLSVN
jgi:hypothetical protein